MFEPAEEGGYACWLEEMPTVQNQGDLQRASHLFVAFGSTVGQPATVRLLERITVEPGKCGGRPCIRGLRIRVADILGMLAEGVPHEEILRDFPYLEPDDIK